MPGLLNVSKIFKTNWKNYARKRTNNPNLHRRDYFSRIRIRLTGWARLGGRVYPELEKVEILKEAICHACGAKNYLIKDGVDSYKWVTKPKNKNTWKCGKGQPGVTH